MWPEIIFLGGIKHFLMAVDHSISLCFWFQCKLMRWLSNGCITEIYSSVCCTTLPPTPGYQLWWSVLLWSLSEITPCPGALCRTREDQLKTNVFTSKSSFHSHGVSVPSFFSSDRANSNSDQCGRNSEQIISIKVKGNAQFYCCKIM